MEMTIRNYATREPNSSEITLERREYQPEGEQPSSVIYFTQHDGADDKADLWISVQKVPELIAALQALTAPGTTGRPGRR